MLRRRLSRSVLIVLAAAVLAASAGRACAPRWRACAPRSGGPAARQQVAEKSVAGQAGKSSPQKAPELLPPPQVRVFVTPHGEKYHLRECRYCREKGRFKARGIELGEARRQGYEPCTVCQP